MLVKDLIKLLEDMPADADVHFEYGYGDYWRTTVAPKVSSVGMGEVEFSEYHRMDKVVETDYDSEDDENADAPGTTRTVVLIG